MSVYATRIKALRLDQGMSQEDLAEAVAISQNQISRYERGANDPTGDVLIALARVLNTSTDYLLGVIDDPSPHITNEDLSPTERQVIAAMRRGDRLAAVAIISSGK